MLGVCRSAVGEAPRPPSNGKFQHQQHLSAGPSVRGDGSLILERHRPVNPPPVGATAPRAAVHGSASHRATRDSRTLKSCRHDGVLNSR